MTKPLDPNYRVVRRFKSRSDKKKGETTYHVVTMDKTGGTGKLRCTCKGYGYTGNCWHVSRTLEQIVERGYKL